MRHLVLVEVSGETGVEDWPECVTAIRDVPHVWAVVTGTDDGYETAAKNIRLYIHRRDAIRELVRRANAANGHYRHMTDTVMPDIDTGTAWFMPYGDHGAHGHMAFPVAIAIAGSN